MSLRQIRNLDGLAKRIATVWRKVLVRRHLDAQLLPRASSSGAAGLFAKALCEARSLMARRAIIREECRHRARTEVTERWRARLRFRQERSRARVLEAVRGVLMSEAAKITGRKVTLACFGPPVESDRTAIPDECLAHAAIDILAETIGEGAQKWCSVSVTSSRNSPTDASVDLTETSAASPLDNAEDHEVVSGRPLKPGGEPVPERASPSRAKAIAEGGQKARRKRAPSKVSQLAAWLVSKDRSFIEASQLNDLGRAYSEELGLKTAPSSRSIVRAKSAALERLDMRQCAPDRAR